MYIEKIFDLVRKEEVVLWVGSGFSKYAGYPVGDELSKILYDNLSKPEKKANNKLENLSLPDLSEEFVRLKLDSRTTLNTILQNIFLKAPKSLKFHELISNIPHIQSIITTNYDNSFELAYKESAIKITSQNDIAYIDGKIEIFKVHGDLKNFESIIITKSDYAKFFFNNEQSNLFWTTVIERISNKVIVFIGYGFEDDNIKNIIEKISQILKTDRKEIFLIAPKYPPQKVAHLNQKGIQYIDMKGEVFIEKLYKNIKENIVADFDKGLVNPETFRKFMQKNGLSIDLKSDNDRYKLKSINSLDGQLNGIINLKLKNDKKFITNFSDLITGKKFGEIEINHKVLHDFKFVANDINLIGGDFKNYKLILTSKPVKVGLIDIVFEDGFEFSDIHYKINRSEKAIEVIATFKNSELIFQLDLNSKEELFTNFKYDQKGSFEKINEALQIYNLLKKICTGISFTIYPKDQSESFNLSPQAIKSNLDNIETNILYFEALKNIEEVYKFRFRNINFPTNTDLENTEMALEFAKGESITIDWKDELEFDLAKGANLEDLLKVHQEGIPILAQEQQKTEIQIHGHTISLGYKNVKFLLPNIVNYAEVVSKETSRVKIKSKIGKMEVSFTKAKEHTDKGHFI